MKVMRYIVISILLLLPGLLPAQTFTVEVSRQGDGCEGSKVTLLALVDGGGSAGFRFEWRKAGAIHDRTVGENWMYTINKVSITDSGRYYCMVTDLSDSTTVRSNELIVGAERLPVFLPQNLIVTEGEKLKIPATDDMGILLSGTLLDWGPGMRKENPLQFVAGNQNTMLRVVYKKNMCVGSDSAFIWVKPKDNYLGLFDDGYARASSSFRVTVNLPEWFCNGQPLKLSAEAKGDAGSSSYIYTWYRKRGQHEEYVGRDSVLVIQHARAEDAGDYFCSVLDKQNDITVRSEVKTISFRPFRVELPELFYATQGESLNVTALDSSGTAVLQDSLVWYKRNTGGLWAKMGRLMNPCEFIAGESDMEIKVIYTNNRKCTATDSLPVYVRASSNFLGGGEDGFSLGGSNFTVNVEAPLKREFCENERIVINADVKGETDGYVFRWWKVGRPVDHIVGESASLEISRTLLSDAGYYYCTARDNEGGFTASSDTVLLIPRQVVLPEVMYATAGEDLTLTVLDGKGDTIRGNMTWTKRLNIDWRPLSVIGTNPVRFYADNSNMVVRVSYNFGSCAAMDTMPVYIKHPLSFSGEKEDGYSRTFIPPVIRKNLNLEQICTVTDSVTLQIWADGSDIRYEWQLLSGSEFSRVVLNGAQGVDEPRLILKGLRAGLSGEFSGFFRCRVSCGDSLAIYSDTVKVFANHRLRIKLDRDTVAVYKGQVEKVEVSLVDGVKPWLYNYKTPFGQEMVSDSIYLAADSVEVNLPGIYRFVSLRDSLGCEITADLPQILVTTPEIPKVKIERLSDENICPGGDVYLRVTVRDGVGPWKVWLNVLSEGVISTAEIPGVEMPLLITKAEGGKKSLGMTIDKSTVYLVDSIVDLNDGHGEWAGTIEGTGAVVNVMDGDLVSFGRLSDNHIGLCRPLDLFDKLKPSIAGQPLTTGLFKVDGSEVPSGIWSINTPASYSVSYVYTNAAGCKSIADIVLVADARPVATVLLAEELCAGDEEELQVKLNGNNFTFTLGQERIAFGNQASVVTNRLISTGESPDFIENIRFLPEDSCLIYRLSDLKDRHGCSSITSALSKTIYQHVIPKVKLYSRYPDENGNDWLPVKDTIWIFEGAVGIKTTLMAGVIPWNLRIDRQPLMMRSNSGIQSRGLTPQEKQNSIPDEGSYHCYVSDRYCENNTPAVFVVQRQKPAYLRLKLFLEGDMKPEGTNVVVELRRAVTATEAAAKGTVVASDICRVLPDGTVWDKEGNSIIRLVDYGVRNETEKLYVVVKHEGHLAVMSARPYLITDDRSKAVLVDFSDGGNVYINSADLSAHMTKIGERDGKDIWALSAVDEKGNALISVKDGNEITCEGDREACLTITRKNRDKYSEIE